MLTTAGFSGSIPVEPRPIRFLGRSSPSPMKVATSQERPGGMTCHVHAPSSSRVTLTVLLDAHLPHPSLAPKVLVGIMESIYNAIARHFPLGSPSRMFVRDSQPLAAG